MAQLKTRPGALGVDDFLSAVEPQTRKADCYSLVKLMQELTGDEPVMWGPSIIGFGNIHLKYTSGRELDWFKTGFAPRKQNLTIYLMGGFEQQAETLSQLGKFKKGKGCLYIKQLADINSDVLCVLIRSSLELQQRFCTGPGPEFS